MITFLALCLTGCLKVGPDYEKPETKSPDAWDGSQDPSIKPNESDLRNWWLVFEDNILTGLITTAGENNLDLKTAYARVKEAKAQIGVARGELLPALDGSGQIIRQRTSEYDEVPGGVTFDNYSIGANASWEIDFWGRVRRSVEYAVAGYQATEEDRVDVMITLYANVAQSYFQLRSSQARLAAAYENIISQKEVLKLTRSRFINGLATDLDVSQAELVLASTEASIPPLKISLAQAINAIDLLLGQNPGKSRELLEPVLPLPQLPPEVSVGIPADILRRRPDIRMAERKLAAATANVGVATAELYPKFSLVGSIGFSAANGGDMFRSGSDYFSFGPQFQWRLFEGGRIRAEIAVADAQTEQALYTYEQTVLSAMNEVQNAITSYVQTRIRVAALERTVQSSKRTLDLAIQLYKDGLQNFQPVLDAQRTLFQYQDQLAEVQGQAASDLVLLYKALGGGWQVTPEVPDPMKQTVQTADAGKVSAPQGASN